MTTELERLAALRGEVRPPAAEARDAAADARARAIAAERGPTGRGDPARGLRRHRRERLQSRPRRRRLPAAVLALAAVALAIVLDTTLQSGSPAAPPTAAAAVLTRLARVAAEQPAAPAPGPGQYLYVRSQDAYADAGDGSGWLRETSGTASFVTPADRADWVAAGSPALPAPGTGTNTEFGAGCLSIGPNDLATLPTDPAALGATLSARRIEGGPPGPAEDFVQVGDMLRETDASPALRAAIYEVAANIPGVLALGIVSDHSGRSGTGLAYDSGGVRSELIFDPSTGGLLGEATIAVGPGAKAPAGTVLGWAVYLEDRIVDSLPVGPPSNRMVAVSGGTPGTCRDVNG